MKRADQDQEDLYGRIPAFLPASTMLAPDLIPFGLFIRAESFPSLNRPTSLLNPFIIVQRIL